MATLVGGITTSHVPAIGRAIARNLQGDPYFKPFFDGFPPAHDWLASAKPDAWSAPRPGRPSTRSPTWSS